MSDDDLRPLRNSGALDEVLQAGGEVLQHDACDSEETWATLPEFVTRSARPCGCMFLVGQKRELGTRGSLLLLHPIGATADLAVVSRAVGLKKGLRPGPSNLLRDALQCDPRFVTPLSACISGASARVAISSVLSEAAPAADEPVTVTGGGGPLLALWLTPTSSLVCSLAALLVPLQSRSVTASVGVPCAAADVSQAPGRPDGQEPSEMVAASLQGYAGPTHWVSDAGDSRVDDFRDLKGGSPNAGLVIAESPETIRVLLRSSFDVRWVLVKPSLFASLRESLEERAARNSGRFVDVLLCEAPLMERISGVPATHASAALAASCRAQQATSLAEVIPRLADPSSKLRVLALDGLDEESVGAMIRVAAAFGIDAVVLSSTCGDPLHRRAVRVSMGHAFRVPAFRGHLPSLLAELRAASVFAVAALPRGAAMQFLDEVGTIPERWACVMGPESGLTPDVVSVCDLALGLRTGPRGGLGLPVAASVLLHGCVEREGR